MNGIYFPNIGIILENIGDSISVFGFEIRFYGLAIMIGFIMAYFLVVNESKRTGQDPEMYLDFMLVLLIPVILGARIYYILFRLDQYIVSGDPWATFLKMINIRAGGLAIYGGIIAGIITGIIFAKVRKVNVMDMADMAPFGLLTGQIIGRFGNFFNREAFGSFTDSLFAMAIPVDYYKSEGTYTSLVTSGIISDDMLANVTEVNGVECILVHPTFLYEAAWNLMILLFLLCYRKHKKFSGEFAFIYVAGYGIGRFFIEGLRTDSLMIGSTGIRVSQMVGLVCFAIGAVYLIHGNLAYLKKRKKGVDTE